MLKKTALALALGLTPILALANAELDALKAELAKQRSVIDQQQQQLNALADKVEQTGASQGSGATTLGMYGEVHFNHRKVAEADSGIDGFGGNDNFHAHRVVFLVGHKFSDSVRFYSEVEFEGAADSHEIETEVEQFLIDWKLANNASLTLGQFLLPVGILNETHEPDAFYGVERNPVEELIIPATWWEKGAMLRLTSAAGVSADIALHTGLKGCMVDGPAGTVCEEKGLGSADGLREFRQEFGRSQFDNPAATVRVKYTGVPGLELGLAVQRQENITQSNQQLAADGGLIGGQANAVLMEAHADWHAGPVGLRALYAAWDIRNAVAEANKTNKLEGFYVEPSFKVNETIGLFARYNQWNTQANQTGVDDIKQVNAGVNYWIDPRVVLKADVQTTDLPNDEGDGFNLGLGLSF